MGPELIRSWSLRLGICNCGDALCSPPIRALHSASNQERKRDDSRARFTLRVYGRAPNGEDRGQEIHETVSFKTNSPAEPAHVMAQP